VHKQLGYEELLEMNPTWGLYPEEVFTRHVRQEEGRFRERSYWCAKLKKKKAKKDEIEELFKELNL
jgi:hypothetical protein